MPNLRKIQTQRKRGVGRRIACAAAALSLLVGLGTHPPADACGFHDPQMVQVGLLNWAYPKSLYVKGAMWHAQKAGLLPPPDSERYAAQGKERELLDLMAYHEARKSLMAIGSAIRDHTASGETTRFSIVLVETCLWTQFHLDAEKEAIEIDVNGPGEGDLVAVSGAPVIHAIRNGDLTIAEAIEAGVIRLYGDPSEIDRFVGAFGEIGSEQLETPPHVLARRMQVRSVPVNQSNAAEHEEAIDSDE